MLFTLFTHDCTPMYTSNSVIKFAGDTTQWHSSLADLRQRGVTLQAWGETSVEWCSENNLVHKTFKTKETVDFRRTTGANLLLHIRGKEVERVENLKFQGVIISKQLTLSCNTSQLFKKAPKRLLPPKTDKAAPTKTAEIPDELCYCMVC